MGQKAGVQFLRGEAAFISPVSVAAEVPNFLSGFRRQIWHNRRWKTCLAQRDTHPARRVGQKPSVQFLRGEAAFISPGSVATEIPNFLSGSRRQISRKPCPLRWLSEEALLTVPVGTNTKPWGQRFLRDLPPLVLCDGT